ncbi:DUF2058 domain-containing protein [Methylomonas sp. AM2-LC]|uniref:DUF2058 domain-containing protein n=1 Tax=Methylomonas sp. AM2-LC TaxID=3153301 RepID=UPI003266BDC9
MKKPQTLSLQEQLLQSGLASDAKAKQVKTDKRKQSKLQRSQGIEIVDELKINLEQTRLQQAERDRELNLLRKQTEEKKALLAQIKQIVTLNRIEQDVNGVLYQFNHLNKVKTVYVSENVRLALISGRIGIICVDNQYEMVPAEIARKIVSRDAESVVLLNENSQEVHATEDPYAAYQIPDDLIW